MHLNIRFSWYFSGPVIKNQDNKKPPFKPTQSRKSLVVSEIVLKNKFTIKCYETVLYTCNIWYLNKMNENSDLIDMIFLCEKWPFVYKLTWIPLATKSHDPWPISITAKMSNWICVCFYVQEMILKDVDFWKSFFQSNEIWLPSLWLSSFRYLSSWSMFLSGKSGDLHQSQTQNMDSFWHAFYNITSMLKLRRVGLVVRVSVSHEVGCGFMP